MVQRAAADPPAEPSVAKKGAIPISRGSDKASAGQMEPSEPHLEGTVRESAARPAEMFAEKVDAGSKTPVTSLRSADSELSEVKLKELPPSSSVEREEAAKSHAEPMLSEPAVVSAPEKEVKEEEKELAGPATHPPEELADDALLGCAMKPAVGELAGARPETVPPDTGAASTGMASSGITQPTNKLGVPEKNAICDAVKTECETTVTPVMEKKPVLQTGSAMEKKLEVAGEVRPEESALKDGRPAEENLEKFLVKTGAETEEKLEKSVAKAGAAVEGAADAVGENNEGRLIKAHQNKGTEPAKPNETPKAAMLNSSFSVKDCSSVGKMILKAVVSLPDISKSRVLSWRNKPSPGKGGEQNAPSKPESQGQAAAVKKTPSKEEAYPCPGSSSPSSGDASDRCQASKSCGVIGKGGTGRNSPPQEKDSQVESRASSKQAQEGGSRGPGTKKDTGSTKVRRAGRPVPCA